MGLILAQKTFVEKFSYETYLFVYFCKYWTCKAMMCEIYGLKDLRIEETILLRSYLHNTFTELFSNSIFCCMWKTEQLFIIFFHLSFRKVLYESVLFFIIKVPYEDFLLSTITCRHLSLTYHTQKYFIKAYYYLAKT